MPLHCAYNITTDNDGDRVARLDGDLEVSLAVSPHPVHPLTDEGVAIIDDGLTRVIITIIGKLGYAITSGPLVPGLVTLDQLITATRK